MQRKRRATVVTVFQQMRILQICSARYIGGGERHVADLSNALSRRGHEVFAAVVPDSPLPAQLQNVSPENIAPFSLKNSLDLLSAVKLARFSRDNNIDVIHAHLAKDYIVAAAASRITSIPYIITRHVLFPMSRAHRRLLSKVSFVIALSNAIAEQLRDNRIFSLEKIVTIRYGIDVSRFPEVSRRPDDGCRVGTIGNLDFVKGMDVFVRAAAITASQRADVQFEMIGEDRSRSGENEKELTRLLAELDLENKVVLSGWSNDIRDRLAGMDIFVSASRSESFGAAIAEAMLCGLPVVATETEGAKEIISDPSLGRLVPIDSPSHLAQSTLELLADPDARDRIGRNARAHIASHFSLERMVDETEAVYKRVVA